MYRGRLSHYGFVGCEEFGSWCKKICWNMTFFGKEIKAVVFKYFLTQWMTKIFRTLVIFWQTFFNILPFLPAIPLTHFNLLSHSNLNDALFNKSSTLQIQDDIRIFSLYSFSHIAGQLGLVFCFCFSSSIICFIILQVYFFGFVMFKFCLLMFHFLKLISLFLK